jgi:triosephosphate isomerase
MDAKIKLPVIIINFKTYAEASGKSAVSLAKLCEKVAKSTKSSIAVAVQSADIAAVSSSVSIPVLAQHVDGVSYGAHTGAVLPEVVKQHGALGTFLNHSEKKLVDKELAAAVKRCKETGLLTVVCAPTAKEAEKIAHLNPDFILVEPPELVGGDISVSTARPELISETVSKVSGVGKIPVLCGAGVKTKVDVQRSIQLGTRGVGLASGITKAKNPEKALRDLVSGMK